MFVECRSFGDLSNRSAIVEQTPVNSTVVVESETKNEELPEVANGTFNADNLNLNETEILPTDNNITFECNKISTKPEENETFSVELEKDQQDDFDKTPTNIEVQEAVEGSSPQEAVKLSVVATKHEETSSEPEVVSEIPEEKCVDTKVDVTPQILEPSTQDETTPTKDSNEDTNKTELEVQEPEITYRNIDEPMDYETSPDNSSKDQESLDTPNQSIEPPSTTNNVFVDKIENTFDVEFKMPSAPVFKQPYDNYSNEEFKACASSCKISKSRKVCVNEEKSAFTNTSMVLEISERMYE